MNIYHSAHTHCTYNEVFWVFKSMNFHLDCYYIDKKDVFSFQLYFSSKSQKTIRMTFRSWCCCVGSLFPGKLEVKGAVNMWLPRGPYFLLISSTLISVSLISNILVKFMWYYFKSRSLCITESSRYLYV